MKILSHQSFKLMSNLCIKFKFYVKNYFVFLSYFYIVINYEYHYSLIFLMKMR